MLRWPPEGIEHRAAGRMNARGSILRFPLFPFLFPRFVGAWREPRASAPRMLLG